MKVKADLILTKTDLFPCSVVIYIDHMKLSRFSMLHGGQIEFKKKNYNLYSASTTEVESFVQNFLNIKSFGVSRNSNEKCFIVYIFFI